MRNKTVNIFLILFCCITVSYSVVPDLPIINTPAASGTTYNTRPWIIFQVKGNTYGVNKVCVRLFQGGMTYPTNVKYDFFNADHASCVAGQIPTGPNSAVFTNLPTTAGVLTTVKHRIQTAMAAGSYSLVIYCMDNSPGADRSGWITSATRTFSIGSYGWTDTTITAGTTEIKATHLNQLRTVITTVRANRGYGATTWTDTLTGGGQIRKTHMDELRTSLNAAVNLVCGSTPAFTDATITAGTTQIRKTHIDELRTRAFWP